MVHVPASRQWRLYVRNIHWMTAAVCAVCLCLYAVSGFILNNDSLFPASGVTEHRLLPLTAPLASEIGALDSDAPLPAHTADALARMFSVDARYATVRKSKGKIDISLPEPGKRIAIEADLKAGTISLDRTDRGIAAYLTDLHKGKNVRPLWHWFINLFAASVVVFTVTGFVLLCLQARARKLTWPLILLGALAPVLFLLVILHL